MYKNIFTKIDNFFISIKIYFTIAIFVFLFAFFVHLATFSKFYIKNSDVNPVRFVFFFAFYFISSFTFLNRIRKKSSLVRIVLYLIFIFLIFYAIFSFLYYSIFVLHASTPQYFDGEYTLYRKGIGIIKHLSLNEYEEAVNVTYKMFTSLFPCLSFFNVILTNGLKKSI